MKFKTTQIIVTDGGEKLGTIEMDEGLEPIFEPNKSVSEFDISELEAIVNKMKEFKNGSST